MSKTTEAIDTVFDELVEAGPFDGTKWELADKISVECWHLDWALATVRDPGFIAEHGWTIPYVQKGRAANTWQVVDAAENADNVVMTISQRRRVEESLNTTRRNIAQAEIAIAAFPDKRATAARHWQQVLTMQRAAEAHYEALLEAI